MCLGRGGGRTRTRIASWEGKARPTRRGTPLIAQRVFPMTFCWCFYFSFFPHGHGQLIVVATATYQIGGVQTVTIAPSLLCIHEQHLYIPKIDGRVHGFHF